MRGSNRNTFMNTTNLTARQKRVLAKHMKARLYDRNGTGSPKRVIARVFVPCTRDGSPALVLVCAYSEPDRRGRFEFCVFTDGLYGRRHVPSDSFGSGTKKAALESLKEKVFGSITGVWPWMIHQTWHDTTQLLKRHGARV